MADGRAGLLEFAVEIAVAAGRIALDLYGRRLTAERKTDDSPVTHADRAAERHCRERIEARFPGDGILGEEFGESRPGAGRRWILDPIDGTRTFVHGVPLFGVLVALEEHGEATLGVMHFPAVDDTLAAARGLGCHWNGSRCSVSDVSRVADATVLTTDIRLAAEHGRRDAWEALAAAAGLARTWGDCYGHALVATGRAEIMVDPVLEIWDAAALAPILAEAGGRFFDWNGAGGHRGRGGISTNAAIEGAARALLGVPAAGPGAGVGSADPMAQ